MHPIEAQEHFTNTFQLIAINSGEQCAMQSVLSMAYLHGPEIQIHGTSCSSQLLAVDSTIIKTDGSLNRLTEMRLTA